MAKVRRKRGLIVNIVYNMHKLIKRITGDRVKWINLYLKNMLTGRDTSDDDNSICTLIQSMVEACDIYGRNTEVFRTVEIVGMKYEIW